MLNRCHKVQTDVRGDVNTKQNDNNDNKIQSNLSLILISVALIYRTGMMHFYNLDMQNPVQYQDHFFLSTT